MADWQAGLTDQDELKDFPSAANPLTAMGIDPDEARANPEMLRSLSGRAYDVGASPAKPAPSAPEKSADTPGSDDVFSPDYDPLGRPSPKTAASPSAAAAGSVGGAGDTPSPSAPPAPASTPQDKLLGMGEEGLVQLNRSLKGANDSAEGMSTTPPEELAKLTAQREKLATPAPLFDPKTGKRLDSTQEYDPDTGQMDTVKSKPSVGSRIWRGVRGGLEGLAMGGIPGALIGAIDPAKVPGNSAYGAPAPEYQRAEARREQQLGATDTGLANAFKSWKDVNDARKEKSGELRAVATTGKDVVTGATGLINAENKPETEANKDAAKAKLTQEQYDIRNNQIRTDPTLSKLPPLQKALYLANGKLPDPREPNEADVTAANIARGIKILGHQPANLDEFNQVIASAKGEMGKGKGQVTVQQSRAVADKKNVAIEKAMAEYAKDPGQPDTVTELSRQVQAAQNAYEEDISILGGDPGPHQVVTVDKSGQVKWTPQAAPPPSAPAAQPAPAGPQAATPTGPPPGATHIARLKTDGRMHYTNSEGTVDLGIAPEQKSK